VAESDLIDRYGAKGAKTEISAIKVAAPRVALAVIDRAILDKEVVVGPGAIVGDGPYDDRPNRREPTRLNTGITVVGKRAIVPRGARIGRKNWGRPWRSTRP